MTLQEAKELAQQGIKMQHNYFADNEWMIMHGNLIEFEDGITIFFGDWTKDKDYLLDGWHKFTQKD